MNKSIKVIYILSSSTKYGGANKSFITTLIGLIEKNVVPYVVLPQGGGLCEIFEYYKIPFFVIPYYLSIYPPLNRLFDFVYFLPRLIRTLLYNFIAIKKLSNLAKKINPDLIHSNVGPVHIGYKVSKKLGIKHVWHLREYQDLDFKMHPLFSMKSFKKKLHRNNNYSIAITNGVYNHFSLFENAKVIYNGILSSNKIQFRQQKEKYFLFAGRIERNKGVNELISAFIEFLNYNSEYKLYIAGDVRNNKFGRFILSYVKQHNISQKVLFLGMRDDIYELMAKATCLIVPSKYEGFGRITAEAMFNGCLVIGNNTAGTKEILESQKLGILYTGHYELVSAMRNIVEKGIESYYPTIYKAQKVAVSSYSVEQNINFVFNYYNEILNK